MTTGEIETMVKFMGETLFGAVNLMMAARAVSLAGSCPRKQVGAVVVCKIDGGWHVVGEGSNRSLHGACGCQEVGCDLVTSQVVVDGMTVQRSNCVRTVHAEINALANIDWSKAYKKPLAVFTNTYPCWHCLKTMVSFGVRGVYFIDLYNPDPRVREYCDQHGVELFDMSGIMSALEERDHAARPNITRLLATTPRYRSNDRGSIERTRPSVDCTRGESTTAFGVASCVVGVGYALGYNGALQLQLFATNT